MKSDVELFSRLYITCQTRDGNLEDFLQRENQAWPPALSDGGRLRLGTKSYILTCLDDLVWDTYKDDSLKGTARAKRGKGVMRHVVGKAALSGNWQNFLRIDSNKRELFSFLSKIRKLSSPMGRGCSAHSYCRMSTPCRHAALKKLIVVCYCM